jgi:hypothetical protein
MQDLIIIENLEIWPNDLGQMDWNEAIREIKTLGPGWRLPTIEELKTVIWPNRFEIPHLEGDFYWSGTEYGAYGLVFKLDISTGISSNFSKNYPFYVRAVRDFDGEKALEYLLKDF